MSSAEACTEEVKKAEKVRKKQRYDGEPHNDREQWYANKSNGKLRALVVEDKQMASAMLQNDGTVDYHRHRALDTGETGDCLRRIRTKEYDRVFVEFPVSGRHVVKEKHHKICAIVLSVGKSVHRRRYSIHTIRQ